MQAIAEKVTGIPNGNNVGAGRGGKQSRAKGKNSEKLDRDVDYATFLQWEKHGIFMWLGTNWIHSLINRRQQYFSVCLAKSCSVTYNTDSI